MWTEIALACNCWDCVSDSYVMLAFRKFYSQQLIRWTTFKFSVCKRPFQTAVSTSQCINTSQDLLYCKLKCPLHILRSFCLWESFITSSKSFRWLKAKFMVKWNRYLDILCCIRVHFFYWFIIVDRELLDFLLRIHWCYKLHLTSWVMCKMAVSTSSPFCYCLCPSTFIFLNLKGWIHFRRQMNLYQQRMICNFKVRDFQKRGNTIYNETLVICVTST